MNYDRVYEQLIAKASARTLTGYSERHHIIPKCMGGTDAKDNLILLTPEEHYLAHQLLVKMELYREHPLHAKLVFAANMMTVGKHRKNKQYGWLKRAVQPLMAQNIRFAQTAEANAKRAASNTGKKRSQSTKDKIAKSKLGKKREPFSDEWKANMGCPGEKNGMFGRNHSEITKDKISQANKGKVRTAEQRARISEQQKGLKDSEETKRLKSIAMKKVWEERRRSKQYEL